MSRWQAFSTALSFPSERLEEMCRTGELRHALGVSGPEFAPLHDAAITRVSLEESYISLFELPGGGAACPLYTGVYAHSRREAMEELIRFYRHAGLGPAASARDLPDAVPAVLEFLEFLAWRAEGSPPVAESALRMTGDVLERHLLPWLNEARTRLDKQAPGGFYATVVRALELLVLTEREHTRAVPAG